MSQMSCSRGSLVCCKLVVLNEIATVWEKSRPMQYFSLQFTLIVHSESFLVKKQKNEEKAGTISARSYQSYSILSTVLVFSVSLNTCLFKKKINSHLFILSSHKLLLIKLAKTSMNFPFSDTVHPSTPIFLISFKCQQFLFFCFSSPFIHFLLFIISYPLLTMLQISKLA